MNRLLRLPLPEPYVPTRLEAVRDRLRARKTTTPARTPAKAPRRTGDRKPEHKSTAAPRHKPQPGKRRSRSGAKQPVKAARSSIGYGADQRNQGRRVRALEGQRHG